MITAPPPDVTAAIDRGLLSQALINVLANAAEAALQGPESPHVRLAAERTPRGRNGPGIGLPDPSVIDRPFYHQGDRDGCRTQPGAAGAAGARRGDRGGSDGRARGDHSDDDLSPAPGKRQVRGYAICTQPRSGSNLLCQCLASTGLLGNPLEYFNGPGRRALGMPDYPDDPQQQAQLALQLGATANGVYGLKLFAYQHAAIAHSICWTEVFPNLRFIYLERRDRLGQALSWARALQTDQYRSTQTVGREPAYAARDIQDRLRALAGERAHWDAFFTRMGVDPLRVVYEDFAAQPAVDVMRIAALMDVDAPVAIDPGKVDLNVQRDRLSESWRQRFLAEFGDPNRLD